MEGKRSTRRRTEDVEMADWTDRLKRAAFLWPLLVGALAVLGFKWVSPDSRTTALEAQMKAVPDSIAAAVAPLKAELRLQALQDSLHAVGDSVRDARLERVERIGRLQMVLQCAALTPRELQFVQSLEAVCDRNSQRAGIPYRRGDP